jgi:hypothetical protein
MEKRVASRVVATDIYHYIRFHNAFQSKVNTPHPIRRIVMRGTKAIVLIAGLLSASRLLACISSNFEFLRIEFARFVARQEHRCGEQQ